MKRIFLFSILVIFTCFSVYADKPVTTVLDFNVNSVSENDMKSIISFLSASLFDTGRYRVIDTAQRDTILKELEFSMSGCSDDSCGLEIGKLLSAEYIVTGDIAKVGSRYILTARMLETETSETKGTAKGIYENLDAMIDDMPVFAENLAGAEPVADASAVVEAPAEVEVVKAEEKAAPTEPLNTHKVFAWSTLGAGVAMLGTGTYFLVDSILKINAANDAEDAYMSAESDTAAAAAYVEYITAFNAAENSNTMFWVGAGLIGGGVLSTIVSVLLFGNAADDAGTQVAMSVGPQSFAVRLSY